MTNWGRRKIMLKEQTVRDKLESLLVSELDFASKEDTGNHLLNVNMILDALNKITDVVWRDDE